MTDAMRSEFEAEYPLPENATFNGDVYIAPVPAEGMTAYNVRWDAWKRAWQEARTVPALHAEQIRVAAVAAIREVTGCPDIKGKDGAYLVDTLIVNLLEPAAPEPKP